MNATPSTASRKHKRSEAETLTLDQIAQRINDAGAEYAQAIKDSLTQAVLIGKYATWAKERVAHGQFIPWMEANVKFSRGWIRLCVRAYEAHTMLMERHDGSEILARVTSVEGLARMRAALVRDDPDPLEPTVRGIIGRPVMSGMTPELRAMYDDIRRLTSAIKAGSDYPHAWRELQRIAQKSPKPSK